MKEGNFDSLINQQAEDQQKLLKLEPIDPPQNDDGSIKEGVPPPTTLDFRGLHPQTPYESVFLWAKAKMDLIIGEAELNKDKKKKKYEQLNSAYIRGKGFLIMTLGYDPKELSKGPEKLSSEKDVMSLLGKTLLVQPTREYLNRALVYCRLVKATIVAFETFRHDIETIVESTEAFEDKLISKRDVLSSSNIHPFLWDSGAVDEKGNRKFLFSKGSITGVLESRAKDVQKIMLRFITRPEANAKTALKDAIASRITIKEKDAKDLLPALCEWLAEEMGVDVSSLNIENDSFFSAEEAGRVELKLRKILGGDVKIETHESNKTSMGEYICLKITGVLNFSANHNINNSQSENARQFEIQIVPEGNRNEDGRMNHHVYDAFKKIAARTRLDGYCPEAAFLKFIQEASKESGIGKAKIIKYLTLDGEKPLVVQESRNNRKIYKARYVIERWVDLGFGDVE